MNINCQKKLCIMYCSLYLYCIHEGACRTIIASMWNTNCLDLWSNVVVFGCRFCHYSPYPVLLAPVPCSPAHSVVNSSLPSGDYKHIWTGTAGCSATTALSVTRDSCQRDDTKVTWPSTPAGDHSRAQNVKRPSVMWILWGIIWRNVKMGIDLPQVSHRQHGPWQKVLTKRMVPPKAKTRRIT